ncbi:hypothetical protein JM83_0897 [Gillisia sp. Hel_I_86]|uniref:hypothetical protein n=1 Tax=Gillisia sp. Hel_I_86 TaxID=1249981 RepID=UPI001199C67B|nr:hypothetical protein [Gillisia sp. Hel_I_86]TVZ25955.1 hypothetical protein JM83_0897 [Gillisia sp. Hel_I_86]
MKTFFWILIIVLIVGCNQKKTETTNESTKKEVQLALAKKLEASKMEVTLLPEAQEITNEWLAYITAQSEIENLKNYTLNDVIANAAPITEIMKSLQETVPARLKSNAVRARLGVLVTKSKILQQLANKRTVNPEEISKTAKELPLEWNNFKIQVNELFLKTLEEFEEELDEIENEEEQPTNRLIPPLRKRPMNLKKIRDSI